METSLIAEAKTTPLRRFPYGLPFIFLWLTFALLPIAHTAIIPGVPAYWSEAMLGASFLALFLDRPRAALRELFRILREERLVFSFVGIFLLGVVIAYRLNPHTISGLGEIKSFYVVPVLFLVAILAQGESRERLDRLVFAWLLGIMAVSIAALVAFMNGWLSYDGRLAGPYLSPNYLAMLVAPGVLLAGYSFACAAGRSRWFFLMGALLALLTLLATRSYAACAALGIVVIGMGLGLIRLAKPQRWAALVFALVALLAVFIFQERGTEKWDSLVSGSERSSLASRLMIWRSAAKIADDSFPWGIGAGRFQELYLANQANFPPYLEWAVPTPHNLYLHFLLEGGVLALIGWIGVVSLILYRAWQHFPGRSHPIFPLLILGLSLIIFYLSYGLVDTPYMKNDLVLAVWGSLGICLAALRIRE